MSYGRHIMLMVLVMLTLLAAIAAAQQPNPQLVVGINAIDTGDYEQAVTSLKQAVEAQPNSEVALFHLGIAYFHLQQYPGGIGRGHKCLS